MDFFGIGPGEILLIMVIALIVVGPGKIVKVSRDLGKAVHAFRKVSSELTAQVTRELDLEEKNSQSPPTDEKATPAEKPVDLPKTTP